jgi:hypothetical protein
MPLLACAALLIWGVMPGTLAASPGPTVPEAQGTDAEAAPAPEVALHSAETILERAIEAGGGRQAMEQTRNRMVKGKAVFKAMGLQGSLTGYEAPPNLRYARIELEGLGAVEEGVDGHEAWEMSSLQGPRLKDGEEKEITLFRSEFNGDLRWKERYTSVETTGTETVNERPCYKLVLVPKIGRPETRFYDTETYTLHRVDTTEVTIMGEVPAQTLLSDYREVDGLLLPFHTLQKVLTVEIEVILDEVQHNVEIPEGRFDLPPAVQELIAPAAEPEPQEAAEPPAPVENVETR